MFVSDGGITPLKKKVTQELDRISDYSDVDVIEEVTQVTEIPKQPEFYKIPRRFGSIPVDELPLGCDKDKQYYKIYPRVALPFQKADRVSFGHPELESNRLFWGDNLHVMRMLPSNSIDLIYIDPPFFSGRNYNVIFGDQNEIRSFTDIWEGGMPSYLVWLNARLLEMKRLLKPTGSIYIHLDYHASHYVKVEMDKIFGYDNFVNEIVWCYTGPRKSKKAYSKKHDVLLFYGKTDEYDFEPPRIPHKSGVHNTGQVFNSFRQGNQKMKKAMERQGKLLEDWWIDIWAGDRYRKELIGYPTQKPEALLERIIKASSKEGDVIADFFCGGGTVPATAQKLNRKWIACDQSRVAVAITQGRLESLHEKVASTGTQQTLLPIPDISVEYWGTYEIPALEALADMEFRNFVVSAYGGRTTSGDGYIHGYKRQSPLFVGSSKQKNRVTKADVIKFAREVKEIKGHNKGVMLAWSFAPSARTVAEKLRGENHADIDLIQITLTDIGSDSFKDHISRLHDEYKSLLTFILPPEIFLHHKRMGSMTYEFDASESIALNRGSKIVNVQWDFDYQGRFTPTQGFAYGRQGSGDKIKPLFVVKHKFKHIGKIHIACRVQDDLGGEKIHSEIISVR